MKVHIIIGTNLNIRMTRLENIYYLELSPFKILWVKEVHCHETSMFLHPSTSANNAFTNVTLLLSSMTKNDANTYLSVRDTVFRKHEKIVFLKLPLELASSIPQKYLIFVSTIIFSKHTRYCNLLPVLRPKQF
jgi:hypothetical protein